MEVTSATAILGTDFSSITITIPGSFLLIYGRLPVRGQLALGFNAGGAGGDGVIPGFE